jgi:hypothetical protein
MCLPTAPFKIEREWTHAGLLCAATMNTPYGNRCGYVRVPPGHPLHGVDPLEDTHLSNLIHAHGDVNFGDLEPCAHEDGSGWWFGFDCGHLGDAKRDPDSPPMFEEPPDSSRIEAVMRSGHYWTLDEVAAECESLAEQLAAVGAVAQ